MKYTREQMEKRITNYLMKTSRHLFVKDNGKFYKVMLTKVDATKWAYITVTFDGEYCNVTVDPVVVGNLHNNSLAYLERKIFPQWEGRKAVPYFKDARARMFEVLKLVRKHYDGSKESLIKINEESSEILKGMQLKESA